eukprot:gene301-247_t
MAAGVAGAEMNLAQDTAALLMAKAAGRSAEAPVGNLMMVVTRKEAHEGPEAVKWMEAGSLERLQLESLKCWRPLEPGEMKPGDE